MVNIHYILFRAGDYMKKILTLILLTVFLFGTINALTFEGTKKTFEELGIKKTELTKENNCLTLNYAEWSSLTDTNGILYMILHFGGIYDPEAKIVIFGPDNMPTKHKTVFGVNIAVMYTFKELQNGYLVTSLEDYRTAKQGNFKVCVYLDSVEKTNILQDSEIGSYKLPYFDCENCFSKKPYENKYKVDQKTTMNVNFTNKGYSPAEVTVFWDNEIFTNWFKLRAGQASWEGTLAQNESAKLSYDFIPLIPENFIISPAILKYKINEYEFRTVSNPIIVGTVPYLDTINCQYALNRYEYDLGETATVDVSLYNDYDKEKTISIILDTGKNQQKQSIMLGPQESKWVNFNIKETNEKIVNFTIKLEKEGLNSIKVCGKETIGFINKQTNYLPIIVLLLILIAIGTFVYYYYFL